MRKLGSDFSRSRTGAGVLTNGIAGATLLAIGVGFLGTWRLLGRKPLGVLRGE